MSTFTVVEQRISKHNEPPVLEGHKTYFPQSAHYVPATAARISASDSDIDEMCNTAIGCVGVRAGYQNSCFMLGKGSHGRVSVHAAKPENEYIIGWKHSQSDQKRKFQILNISKIVMSSSWGKTDVAHADF